MHAGARAIVATSWKVADRETAWLMRELYRGLGDGLPPDEALQRAQQRAIADGGRNAALASWGAFMLIGDGRTPLITPRPGWQPHWALVSIPVVAVAGLGVIAFRRRRSAQRSPSGNAEAGSR
jgi:hypothetical protein